MVTELKYRNSLLRYDVYAHVLATLYGIINDFDCKFLLFSLVSRTQAVNFTLQVLSRRIYALLIFRHFMILIRANLVIYLISYVIVTPVKWKKIQKSIFQ